jgi:hypothetical protein
MLGGRTWEPRPAEAGCPADLVGNDALDFGDLLLELAEWGSST